MRFTLRQLQVFVSVAQQGNVSRAAESLSLSQSAASTSLTELERQSGCQLFDRAGKRLSLNALGRQLLPQAVALLDQAREIEDLLKSGGQCVVFDFLDSAGIVIKSFNRDSARGGQQGGPGGGRGGAGAAQRVPNRAGLNQYAWNLRYPDASTFRGIIMWAANTTGLVAPPGTYAVRITVDGQAPQTQRFRVLQDPRTQESAADLKAQFGSSGSSWLYAGYMHAEEA